ncbi:MAG TPA: ECF transporter S component [Anaerolineae bacterium]|nr:ECF transporter S component [Anaerolineae bacterium]
MKHRQPNPLALALVAVMTSITFVLTYLVKVPTPGRGYAHLGDTGVFFAAFAFGPWIGAASGGIGTLLSDWAGGYSQWAPFSLLIHGLQGLVVGWVWRRWQPLIRLAEERTAQGSVHEPADKRVGSRLADLVSGVGLVFSAMLGAIIVIGGYFAAGIPLTGIGAATGDIPFNIVQVTLGAAAGVPLYLLVRAAYPPINRWRG